MRKTIQHIPQLPQAALKTVGALIAAARKAKHWRQVDLAKRLNLVRQTVARMEHGDPNVAAGYYFAAAWVLRVPIFPGMELEDRAFREKLNQLNILIKTQLPERVVAQKRKPIDDNF